MIGIGIGNEINCESVVQYVLLDFYDDKQRQTAGTRKNIVLNFEFVVCAAIFF
jgi:hypothetical protein